MLQNPIIFDGLIYTAGFSLIILVSVLINPRIWLQDMPEEFKENLPPKSPREMRQTFVTGFLFAMFIIGFPLYSLADAVKSSTAPMPFLSMFLHSFSLMMICNVLYWLFIHIIIFNGIVSRVRKVPGLKGRIKFAGWKKQIFGMTVGILSCIIISGFVATIGSFFQ